MQNITNPEVARLTFRDVQTVKIPFTLVNTTLRDMVNIYATPHITLNTKNEILQHLAEMDLHNENVSTTFFYIFGASSYSLFLQLIAKEDTFDCGRRVYTPSVDIIYSKAKASSLDTCPVFTKGDKAFWDIESTPYARVFPKTELHIVRAVTKEVTIGEKPSVTTDYCMFIPGGKIIPKVTTAINNQKSLSIGL